MMSAGGEEQILSYAECCKCRNLAKCTVEAITQTLTDSLLDNAMKTKNKIITKTKAHTRTKKVFVLPVGTNWTEFRTGQFSWWCKSIPPQLLYASLSVSTNDKTAK